MSTKPESQKNKPELLLPAGNRESFYAALEAGADAVYLGLTGFNARRRAANFSAHNLAAVLQEAHSRNVKVYITVNTLVKNEELHEALQLLHLLEQHRVDAIIVQDWGVYYLAKRYFPSLRIHASTQMAVHNSVGVAFCEKMGIERVILARELTMPEVKKIAAEASIGIEVFVHGALCYSFSGCCLFSSFLSGNSANRGLCIQPCRRKYSGEDDGFAFFSLKDNQQIDRVGELSDAGVISFKIEGRLKPADYVYCVGTAYRGVIDEKLSIAEAKTMLQADFGREKTGYFLSGNIAQSITTNTGTGFFLGNVWETDSNGFSIQSSNPIKPKNRLLVKNAESQRQEIVKVEEVVQQGELFRVRTEFQVAGGSAVFLLSENAMHFPNRFPNVEPLKVLRIAPPKMEKMLNSLIPWQEKQRHDQYFVRITTSEWLKNLYLEDYEGIFLRFDKSKMAAFSMGAPILKKNSSRFWLELPPFISEKDLDFYATQCLSYYKMGIKQFVLGHPSQVALLPKEACFATNENCYVFNDAAAAFFTRQRASTWVYPLENEFDNLISGIDRNGIVNMYFRPHLFYSRMPVKLSLEESFSDKSDKKYRKHLFDGITMIVPETPVCLFFFKKRLNKAGFSRFMIDLSYETPDRQAAKLILTKLKSSKPLPDTVEFNFDRGVK